MARKRFGDLPILELQAAFEKIYEGGFSYANETFKLWEQLYKASNDAAGVQQMQELYSKIGMLLSNPPQMDQLY